MSNEQNAIELKHAAKMYGVSQRALYQALRDRGALDANNHPTTDYLRANYFTARFRSHQLPGTNIVRYYTVTRVLPLGLSLISQLAKELKENKPTTQTTTTQAITTGANA